MSWRGRSNLLFDGIQLKKRSSHLGRDCFVGKRPPRNDMADGLGMSVDKFLPYRLFVLIKYLQGFILRRNIGGVA